MDITMIDGALDLHSTLESRTSIQPPTIGIATVLPWRARILVSARLQDGIIFWFAFFAGYLLGHVHKSRNSSTTESLPLKVLGPGVLLVGNVSQ